MTKARRFEGYEAEGSEDDCSAWGVKGVDEFCRDERGGNRGSEMR